MVCMRITDQYIPFSLLFTRYIVLYYIVLYHICILCCIVLRAGMALILTRGAKAF